MVLSRRSKDDGALQQFCVNGAALGGSPAVYIALFYGSRDGLVGGLVGVARHCPALVTVELSPRKTTALLAEILEQLPADARR